jgi:hypothetical protein
VKVLSDIALIEGDMDSLGLAMRLARNHASGWIGGRR